MVVPVGCVSDDDLRRQAAGELTDAEGAAIHDHLDDCPACAAALLVAVRDVAGAQAGGDTAPTPRLDEVDAARTLTATEWSGNHGAAAIAVLPPGTRLGRFEVRDELGSGNMGTVFAGWDPQLARPVAIKVLRAGRDAPDHARRLLREAKAMAQVRHRNVVTVFEVGQDDDVIFIAMERIEGETLRAAMCRRPPIATVEGWLAQAAAGLAAVHRAGLMHRDIKPDNIFIEPGADEPRVVIGDFGLAIGEASDVSGLRISSAAVGTRGAGTPAYMAPEQLEAMPLDVRADVFAFGVAAWELLVGRRPFEGKTAAALHDAIMRGPTTRLRAPGLRRSTARLIEQCVLADPAARPASMVEVAAGLVVAPRRRRWLVPVVIAAAAGAVAPVAYVAVMRGQRLERVGTIVPCDADATPRWTTARDAWQAAAVGLTANTRSQIVQGMDVRAAAWRTAAAAGCTGNVLGRQAFASCRERVEGREATILDDGVAASWPDDGAFLELVVGLDRPAACVGRQAAEDGLALATMSDATRAVVRTGRAELAHAAVAAARGDTTATRAALMRASGAALAAQSSPLDGELALARLRLDPPAEPRARQQAARALAADAERSGVTALVAEAWLELAASTHVAATADAHEIEDAHTRADWAITRLGDPPALRLRWLVSMGRMLAVQGNREAAAARLREALAVAGGDPDVRTLQQAALAELATVLGDDRQLIALYQAQLAEPRLAQADQAMFRGALLLRQAEAQHRVGDLAAAQASLDQIGAITSTDAGLEPVRLATALVRASLASERDQPAVALALLDGALATAARLFGAESAAVADVHARLAMVLIGHDDPAAAVGHLQAAIPLYRARLGPRSQPEVTARGLLVEALRDVGRLADAMAELATLVPDAEKVFGADNPLAAQVRLPQASVLAELGRADEAIATLERALAVFAAHPFAPDTVATAELQLADLLYPRDAARALALVHAADARLVAAGWDATQRADLTTWLAAHPAPPRRTR